LNHRLDNTTPVTTLRGCSKSGFSGKSPPWKGNHIPPISRTSNGATWNWPRPLPMIATRGLGCLLGRRPQRPLVRTHVGRMSERRRNGSGVKGDAPDVQQWNHESRLRNGDDGNVSKLEAGWPTSRPLGQAWPTPQQEKAPASSGPRGRTVGQGFTRSWPRISLSRPCGTATRRPWPSALVVWRNTTWPRASVRQGLSSSPGRPSP
jgi:hypothetical protein